MGTNFLTDFIISALKSFRVKNEKVWAVIIFIAGILIAFAQKGTLLGLFSLPQWALDAVQWVSVAVAALTSPELPATAKNVYDVDTTNREGATQE